MASPRSVDLSNRHRQFLLLHPKDNVLICARAANPGDVVYIDGEEYVLPSKVELGHKIARVPLKEGDTILRYGIPIGSMTSAASPGDHVHSHNLKSDYIAAHSRDAVHIEEIRS